MFCAREQVDIPESELRYEEAWGWVHRTDDPHTVGGSPVDDGTQRPKHHSSTSAEMTGSVTPDG
jgi:hypothetical protein